MTTEYRGFKIISTEFRGKFVIGVLPLNAEKFDMDEELDLNDILSPENSETEDEGIFNAKQNIDIFLGNNIYTEFGYEPITIIPYNI